MRNIMQLDEAKRILKNAGLIAEEVAENATALMASNRYEGQVDEIVDEIEKVKPVKNYYEVDPGESYVKRQFEIVMQDDTVWEVQFRKGHGYWWRGNVYPWRIIQNNKGGFTQIAFSMRMLKSYMKNVKAIQDDEVNEDFSMGVGAPCGLDQGIPHGGDCKGVAMVKWGQSAPTGVKAAHYPQYWLNQLQKKKKKKKKKVFKESCYEYLTAENQFLDESLNEADILSRAKEVLTRFKDSITTAIRRQDSTEAEATQNDIEQFKKEVKNSDKFTTSKSTILGAIAILLMASNMAVAGDFHQADRYMHRLNHHYTSQEVIPSRTVYHDGPDRRDLRFQDDDPTNDYVDPRDYRPPHDKHFGPHHHHHHKHGKTTTISIGKGGLKIHTESFLGEASILTEASAKEMLKKIPGVLANFKKKLSAGKKEEVQNNIEDLQDEIKSSGVLSKFRNAKGLQKTIFTTMAVLMLAAGGAQAANNANMDSYLGSQHGSTTMTSDGSNFDAVFDNMEKEIDKACKDAGQDPNHCNVLIHGDPHHSDGNSSDGISLHVEKDKDISGGHLYMLNVSSDGEHEGFWLVKQMDDGQVSVKQYTQGGETDYKVASDNQIAWLNAHGNNFLK